jgi:hypothetical protein
MSDEEHARRFITIMKQANTGPGEIMTLGALLNEWQKPESAKPEDILSGLEYARRQGWIERAGDHAVCLTPMGAAI